MKISIVIPLYNAEKYVEKCLRSCVEQDLDHNEYEIIVINDGTQDASLKIVERIAKEYKNISIYSQENAGLSMARNKGLSLATGKYVWFVDSDDWIKKNCLRYLLKSIDGRDVLAMGLIRSFEDGTSIERQEYIEETNILQGKDLLLTKFFPQVPTYIMRREFLLKNDLKFYKGIYHEDNEFTPRMLYLSDKIKVLNSSFYFVLKRPGSITTLFNPKSSFDNITVAKSLSEFSRRIDNKFRQAFSNYISIIINNSLNKILKADKIEQRKLDKYIYENRYLFKHLKESSIMKYKLEGIIFSMFPKNTKSVYSILQKFNREKY